MHFKQPILKLGIRIDQLANRKLYNSFSLLKYLCFVSFIRNQSDWLENSGFVVSELVDGKDF